MDRERGLYIGAARVVMAGNFDSNQDGISISLSFHPCTFIARL